MILARNAQKEFLKGQSSRSHATYRRPSLASLQISFVDKNLRDSNTILTAGRAEDDGGTERSVADGVACLYFEVVGRPRTESVHGRRRLVPDDAFHDPLAVRLSRVRRVEQHVTCTTDSQQSQQDESET